MIPTNNNNNKKQQQYDKFRVYLSFLLLLFKKNPCTPRDSHCDVFNRPGLAGAVQQSPLSLTNLVSHSSNTAQWSVVQLRAIQFSVVQYSVV